VRTFPIVKHWSEREERRTSIPWEMIAPHGRQAFRNHDQTLERLAERGGLSPGEAVAVLEDRKWQAMPREVAWDALEQHVQAWEAARPC
jgi:hypothetical protein